MSKIELFALALLLAAAASIIYGAALIYRPAGFIVGGLIGAGLAWAVPGDRR